MRRGATSLGRIVLSLLMLAPWGSASSAGEPGDSSTDRVRRVRPGFIWPLVELYESWPRETALDHPELADAPTVWRDAIRYAWRTIDFAEFYASDTTSSALTTVIEELGAAAAHGVKIRFLAEKKFHQTYPQVLDRLGAYPGIEVRLYDVAPLMGGVLHAKYFIVDEQDVYLGSQNFDWRSLEHIQELGVRISDPEVAGAFHRVFEADWMMAGGGEPRIALGAVDLGASSPREGDEGFRNVIACGDTVRVLPVFSPREWIPSGLRWDLPELVRLIDAADSSIRVQLLTYRSTDHEGKHFDDLEAALRRAAARGVQVQMLLSNWCQREGTIEGLQSLEPLPNLEVKLVTIPPWSGGFIPYARVIHAKYLVVDGERAWIGTSNWERDYFLSSRNAGVILQSRAIGAQLDRFFLDGWNGPYAKSVDPCTTYEAPRIGG